MVVVPRAERQAPPAAQVALRPDTLTLLGSAGSERRRLAQAESAIAVVRGEAAAAAAATAASGADTLLAGDVAVRDSLLSRIQRLDGLLVRAEQAPLPSSYRTLAAQPELRADPRVRALVDSLADIEREREAFGAVGGVDPIYVALTSRASEIGRAIQAIAGERRNAMVAELSPVTPMAPSVAATTSADTAGLLAARDSIAAVLRQADEELARRRTTARELDLREERARERANAVAPPLALLAAAFVLSAVIGFAFAFVGELRRPRVSDSKELERFLGVRVLSTVETPMPSADRGRRQADRSAPPYFDPSSEGYQLSYLGLATEHPSLLMTTITGDDPAIAAVVACNLAAVAADEARSTLVVDLEPSCSASAALRARVQPGIVDVLRGDATWPDATVSAQVGRDKSVDLVPYGTGTPVSAEDAVTLLRKDSTRLARYYDAIFVLANAGDVSAGIPAALQSPEVIFCVQPGITPLRQLRAQLDAIRTAGGVIRGIVLWNAERPLLATPRELAARARKRPSAKPTVAVATS